MTKPTVLLSVFIGAVVTTVACGNTLLVEATSGSGAGGAPVRVRADDMRRAGLPVREPV